MTSGDQSTTPGSTPAQRRVGEMVVPIVLGLLVFLSLAGITAAVLVREPTGVRTSPPPMRLGSPTATASTPVTPRLDAPLTDPRETSLHTVQLTTLSCPDLEVRRNAIPADDLEPYLNSLIDCLMGVYTAPLADAGVTLERPNLGPESQVARSGCINSQDEPGDWAGLYCGANGTIYYRTDWQPRQSLHYAEVIAHEFAHHLQQQTGVLDAVHAAQREYQEQPNGLILIQDLSRRIELHAECLTGMALGTGGPFALRPGEFAQFVVARASVPPDWAATHGTGRAQTRWFKAGADATGSLDTCNTFGAQDQLVE